MITLENISLPVEYLNSVLRYDADTGLLYWRERFDVAPNVRSRLKGKVAGHVCESDRYIHIRLRDRLFLGHRIAWAIHFGEWPSEQIDHENGVRHDNRIDNLRDVTRSDNMKNAKIRTNNTTGIVGVHFHTRAGKWQATIKSNGVSYYLGLYGSFEDAVSARKTAEIEHNFHPNHGRIA